MPIALKLRARMTSSPARLHILFSPYGFMPASLEVVTTGPTLELASERPLPLLLLPKRLAKVRVRGMIDK